MRGTSGWWRVATLYAVALGAFAALTSCSGLRDSAPGQSTSNSDRHAPDVAVTITESEVAGLPQWQRDLLNDPGWQQPPLAQSIETPLPAPNHALLDAARTAASTGSRGASYIGGYQPSGDFPKGRYNIRCDSPWGEPPCAICIDGYYYNEVILEADDPPQGHVGVSGVEKGITSSNHFNLTGGASNNALCGIYQLFSDKRSADLGQPYGSNAQFSEICYRADGGPNSGGDPCNTRAYLIRDFIWWKWNQQNFSALPGLNTTALYNILIAPSSDESEPQISSGATTATTQSFYMGSLNEAIYGGAQIVSIQSSNSICDAYRNSIADNRLYYTNPIYGVLLKRWQDSVLKSMAAPNNNPWSGDFGWPVQGPTAYKYGQSTLTGKGAYYAWGMYFERGFIWWVDYINNTNVPDEAQAYSYTGDNVFCRTGDDRFEKLPTIYYGGTGPLGVSVIVEASLNPDRGANAPPAGTFYEVAHRDPPFLLDMHAHGYGGVPDSAGRYQHYTWAFRDGTIGVTNGVAFDDTTKYVQHAYAQKANYHVRVQVVDANGTVAYGDSLPVHVSDYMP